MNDTHDTEDTRRIPGTETTTIATASFGQTLVSEGLAPQEEVDLAVQLQTQLAARGVFLRLGELLVARGVIDEATVGQALELQGTSILVCPQCLAQYNVLIYQRSKRYRCSRCKEYLKHPENLSEVSVEDSIVHSDLEIDALNLASGRDFGKYRILGQISRGGMGIIYKARQPELDRVVAMKVMAKSAATNVQEQEAFNREARAVAKLRHPYVVAIHEVGTLRGVQYYTMDYIEGLPLQTAVTAEGLNPRELAEVFVKLCDAVDYAHSQGILHRDIKPQNIMLDPSHNPVLIDFGIAAKLGEGDQEKDQIVGSPAYLPPEYISGDHHYDVLGEVYALGATLYAILAGRPPHTGIDTVQMLKRATREKIVPLRKVRHAVDQQLESIVMTALNRDARRRYPSAQDMGNDLRRWLEGDEVAGGTSPLGRAWNRIRGKVAAIFGLVLAFVLLAMSLGYSLTLKEQRKEEAGLSSQFERERQELKNQLTRTRLENARLRFAAGDLEKAEDRLSRLLEQQNTPFDLQGKIHSMRAEVRDKRKDPVGAAEDREAAKRLGAFREP